jgi:hypothetical protein
VLTAKLGNTPGERSIKRNDLDANAIDEFIDLVSIAIGKRLHQRLAIGARDHRQGRSPALAKCIDSASMVSIRRIEKPDHNARIKSYRSHSSRNSLRYPGG